MLQDARLSHLRTLSIFEDSNEQLSLIVHNDWASNRASNIDPRVGQTLARALVSKSRDLEQLSISFIADAKQFFDSCHQSCYWPHLRSLTLTSPILTRTAFPKEILELLYNASAAALNMPQLESLVLWFGKKGEACAVIYHRKKASGRASLT